MEEEEEFRKERVAFSGTLTGAFKSVTQNQLRAAMRELFPERPDDFGDWITIRDCVLLDKKTQYV